MNYLKWIGAVIGAAFCGILGGIIGYFLGSYLESVLSGNDTNQNDGTSGGYNRSETSGGYTQQQTARQTFLQNLLLLSAHIIQADGKIMHSEMECVRQFWRQNFSGSVSVEEANDALLKIFEQRKSMSDYQWSQQILTACRRMTMVLSIEERGQLLAFLCEIAKSDNNLDPTEVAELKRIAGYLGFQDTVIDQLLNLGGQTLDEAYKVLGVSPDATDDEVKRAYRKLALQYHPDKVANLGDDVKAAAEKKFKEIGAAKDLIWKARGL